MDYKIFARENYNVSTLNGLEIGDPIIGLKEFLIGKSADQFKQHLRDLLLTVFEKHGWRQYGAPANVYRRAKEVAKLMDFVWLITTCEIGVQHDEVSPDGYYLTEQYKKRTFNKLFIKTPRKNNGADSVAVVPLARAIFNERHGLLLKNNIEEVWLEVALNSSYMRNLTIDAHSIESSTDVRDYWYVGTIIDAAFEIANRPALELDAEKLKYYQLFAVDADHPDCLFGEQLDDLYDGFSIVFWYIDEVKFPKAIRKWYELIAKTDHWKNHNDPGNLLHIKETIQRVVETAWLWTRVGFPKLGNQGVSSKYVRNLSAVQIADPAAFVGYFFEKRRLYEWKALLERWLAQSLSDERPSDTEITGDDCEDIIRLIQVLRLIESRT